MQRTPPAPSPSARKPLTAAATEVALADRDRRRRIAEAAYFLAERRHFAPGHEVDDWLEAERAVGAAGKRNRAKS